MASHPDKQNDTQHQHILTKNDMSSSSSEAEKPGAYQHVGSELRRSGRSTQNKTPLHNLDNIDARGRIKRIYPRIGPQYQAVVPDISTLLEKPRLAEREPQIRECGYSH